MWSRDVVTAVCKSGGMWPTECQGAAGLRAPCTPFSHWLAGYVQGHVSVTRTTTDCRTRTWASSTRRRQHVPLCAQGQ